MQGSMKEASVEEREVYTIDKTVTLELLKTHIKRSFNYTYKIISKQCMM